MRRIKKKNFQKCYEQKQYKKGLQHVKEILKKFPEHGGTFKNIKKQKYKKKKKILFINFIFYK